MEEVLQLMIPIIALSIPMVAVAGRFVVKPLVEAITRAGSERTNREQQALAGRLALLEERLGGMERTLRQVQEAQSFQAQISAGRGQPVPVPDVAGRESGPPRTNP